MTTNNSFDSLIDEGLALQGRGNLSAAIDLFIQAEKLRPGDAEALCLLGMAEFTSGKHDAGLEKIKQSVALEPSEPRFLMQLAIAMGQSGNHQESLSHLKTVAPHFQSDTQFGKLYAQTALNAGAKNEALHVSRMLIQAMPQDIESWHLNSKACFQINDITAAKNAYAQTIKLKPSASAEDMVAMARYDMQLNDPEAAFSWIQNCLSSNPGFVPALETQARLFLYTGKAEEAKDVAQKLLKMASDNVAAICILLELENSPGDDLLSTAQKLSDDTSKPLFERKAVLYELARSYDRAQDFKKAFATIEAANQLSIQHRVNKGEVFDPAVAHARALLAKTVFDSEFRIKAASLFPADAIKGPRPIFVVGPPRSGTSLTEKLLSGALHTSGLGERGATLQHFNQILDEAELNGVQEAQEHALKALPSIAETERNNWAALAPDCSAVVDKTPAHLEASGWLASLFPDAIFVNLQRDPRDVGLSCFFQDMPTEYGYCNDLVQIADALDTASETAKHWNKSELHWVNFDYDSFVSDPEKQARNLVSACGLEWDDAILETARPNTMKGLSALAASGAIHSRRSGRWSNYREELLPLIQKLES